jgi:hypothetical protein
VVTCVVQQKQTEEVEATAPTFELACDSRLVVYASEIGKPTSVFTAVDLVDKNLPKYNDTNDAWWTLLETIPRAVFSLVCPHKYERAVMRNKVLDKVTEAMRFSYPLSTLAPLTDLADFVELVTRYTFRKGDARPAHTLMIVPVMIAGIVQWLNSVLGPMIRTNANNERVNRTVLKALNDANFRPSETSHMIPWINLVYFIDNSETAVALCHLQAPSWASACFGRNIPRLSQLVADKKC